ncbi:MAG: type IV toxin-antitoxin system AbiEi family antitoxin domain-containing protein [Paludibacter sp.]|jgi:hypothetical protein
MISSRKNNNLLFSIYTDKRTVFSKNMIALLMDNSDREKLNNSLNYYVKSGKLLNPRKGIYAKTVYNPEELACTLYTPSYISLEYVLQRAGVIFQYDEKITSVSYLSRRLEIDNKTYQYRKIKNEILINFEGINRENNLNIANPERALLDTLYLNPEYFFDNINLLDKDLIYSYLNIYKSKRLDERVQALFK